jgi:Mg-chelatase subunit ChlD
MFHVFVQHAGPGDALDLEPEAFTAMLRKSLFALVLSTSLFGCKKKGGSDMSPAIELAEKSAVGPAGASAGSGYSGSVVAAEPPPTEAKADRAYDGEAPKGISPPAMAPGTGRAGGTALGRPADPDMAPRLKRVEPNISAGVRAGEWDDNANYRDFAKWLQESPRNVARLDIKDRQFVVVKDKHGKPVPNCRISIESNGNTTSLTTMASGRALWFPHAYNAGNTATATALCGGETKVSAKLAGQLDTITQLVLQTEREVPARRTIDLAFVLDTTGSMSEEIEAVKQTINAVAAQLSTDQTDVRIGLVEYKDRGDELVTKAYPFSSNLKAFSRSVAGLSASGGGDVPEDMQKGVQDALEKLQWRTNAVSRMVVVIADAPPQLHYQDEKTFVQSAKLAAEKGIKLFTVSASGMNDVGQVVMRQMAQFTGASNMFVLRGGAGPQSVGGGDPKSSCGGTQEQYSSGKLDKLIINKIKQELAAIDGDPMRIAGIGKDESAKPCNERIVMAY